MHGGIPQGPSTPFEAGVWCVFGVILLSSFVWMVVVEILSSRHPKNSLLPFLTGDDEIDKLGHIAFSLPNSVLFSVLDEPISPVRKTDRSS